MTLIDDIVKSHSVSVVGMEKNTGKTECLNYIIKNLPLEGLTVAVTSIGVDGETTDIVTGTHKPEIFLREGMMFSTSEKHYRQRHILSELLDVDDESTALGRVVTARALDYGKIMLSGPSTGKGLARWIGRMHSFGAGLTLIDGAISRLSSASPAISEAMVLSTGAALSANLNELVRKTVHTVSIILSDKYEGKCADRLQDVETGLWTIDADGNAEQIEETASALSLSQVKTSLAAGHNGIFVAGAVTDRIVDRLVSDGAKDGFAIVAKDFTKVFISPEKMLLMKRLGLKLEMLASVRLLAVCINPVSPNGMSLDPDRLRGRMEEVLPVPVYDLFRTTGGAE